MDLKELRRRANKGIYEVAQCLSVAESSVRNWESGRTIPKLRIDQFAQLCALYGCSFEDLYQAFQVTIQNTDTEVAYEMPTLMRTDEPSVRRVLSKAETVEKSNQKALNILEDYKQGERDFPKVNLFGTTQLQKVDLRGIDLSSTDLSYAALRKVNLVEANLQQTRLYRAVLIDADLQGADLTKANLNSANLRGANLSRAKLTSAKFRSADLRGANLSQAKVVYTNLARADLTGADLSSTEFRQVRVENAIFGDNKGLSDEQRRQLEYLGAIFEDVPPLYSLEALLDRQISLRDADRATTVKILQELADFGLEFNPKLVSLLEQCSADEVRAAVAAYKTYPHNKLHNPEGLFYQILSNRPSSRGLRAEPELSLREFEIEKKNKDALVTHEFRALPSSEPRNRLISTALLLARDMKSKNIPFFKDMSTDEIQEWINKHAKS